MYKRQGAPDAPQQYIAGPNAPLLPNEAKAFTLGVTLAAGDVVRCYSNSGQVSFNIFGSMIA